MVITPCPGFPLSPGRDPPSKLHRELNKLIRLASRVEQWIALPIRRRPPSHLNLIAFLLISQALSCRYEGGHHLNRIASSRDCWRAFVGVLLWVGVVDQEVDGQKLNDQILVTLGEQRCQLRRTEPRRNDLTGRATQE